MRKLTLEELDQSRPSLENVQTHPFPVSVVLDNIRSLWNVGSIFRTSEGARVTKLYLCGITPRPPRSEIAKTALGAEDLIPWVGLSETSPAIQDLKREGNQIVILEQTDKSIDYRAFHPRFPLALVLGHERIGVSDDVISLADFSIEIPMFGLKHNLNVAVAYGIAVYQLLRQYQLQARK